MFANICSCLRAGPATLAAQCRRATLPFPTNPLPAAALPFTTTLCLLTTLSPTPSPLHAQYEWTASRPDGHAPIGVMGEHTHERGEWMLSYRFMRMRMDGNRNGAERLETSDVHRDFMVAPLDMTMTMHMAGIMYAPGDRLTLMLMANWIDQSMNHETRPGGMFEAASSGLGDAGISALIGLKRTGSVRAHLNAGLSLPVGSIEETGVNPMSMGREVQMPYPMQLGSGTWDIKPGITILGMSERTSWGLQGMGTLRMGANSRGYTLGNVTEGTAWFAVKAADRLSLSARALFRNWRNYSGHDEAYGHRMMVPTIREELRGGTRIDIPLGLNVYFPGGALQGHRIAAEFHLPVHQSLNGPQLETDWLLRLGWQKSFDPIGHH